DRGGAAGARSRVGSDARQVDGMRPAEDGEGGRGPHPLQPRLAALGELRVEPGLENHPDPARPGRAVDTGAVPLDSEEEIGLAGQRAQARLAEDGAKTGDEAPALRAVVAAAHRVELGRDIVQNTAELDRLRFVGTDRLPSDAERGGRE